MAELALALLLMLALAAATAAIAPVGRQGGRGGTSSRATTAGWIALALALVLTGASADVVGVTVLGPEAGLGILVALTAALTAAGAYRRCQRRGPALLLLLLSGLFTFLLVVWQLAVAGQSPAPLTLLGQELAEPTQVQILWLMLLCWAMGAWIGWFAIAERSGLLAVGLPLVALVADLINSPPATQGLPAVPVLVVCVAGVALLGWTHQERQLPLWESMGGKADPPRSGRELKLVALLAVVLGVVALVAPPLNRSNISARFFGGAQVSGPPLIYVESTSGYATDVIPGGAIRNVPTEVLTYRTNAPGGSTYLEGEVFTDFSAGNWFARYTSTVLLSPGTGLPITGAESHLLDQRRVKLTVRYGDESGTATPDLLYAGSPQSIPAQGQGYQVSGVGQGTRLLDVDQVAPVSGSTAILGAGQTLTTYAEVSTAGPSQLERAGKDYPKWVLPYANLEDAGDPVQVAELASQAKQMAGQARNPYSAARNIEAALRNDETYTLKPPPAPAGTWPVLYFLDTSHRGYCQYFAAAMGAMLRALGIPSRLAGGYDAGVDGTVTRADAHVWVQAYFPRYGWINFEPTPPASFERHPHHQAGGGASATTTPTPAPGSPGGPGARFHPGVRQLTSNAHPGTGHKPAGAGPLLLALGGSAGGLLLLLLLLLLWWSSQVRSPNQLRSRLGLLVRVAHGGHPPSLTLHEMAQITSQLSSRTGLEVRLQELADRAERISFGPATAPANLRLTGWAPVGRRYLALLWQAWREGQRTRSEAAPISVDLLAAGSS